MIDRFTNMGFQVEAVVEAFQQCRIPTNGGREVALDPGHMGDITARLVGE